MDSTQGLFVGSPREGRQAVSAILMRLTPKDIERIVKAAEKAVAKKQAKENESK